MRRGNLSPTVARSERGLWRLYLVDPQYGSLGYAGYADWPILEGRYTLAVLFEYAGTLGLVDLDYTDPVGARDDYHGNWGADDLDYLSRYDGLRAVRLNALGAYALGLTGNHQAPAANAADRGPEGATQPGHRGHRRPAGGRPADARCVRTPHLRTGSGRCGRRRCWPRWTPAAASISCATS